MPARTVRWLSGRRVFPGRIPGSTLRRAAFVTGFFVAAGTPALAQSTARASGKPTVTPDDYGKWETLGPGTLAPDGRWLAAPIRRVNEHDELRIHQVGSDSVIVVPEATDPVFSADSRWVAFSVGRSPEERKALERNDEPVPTDLGLVDLESGARTTVSGVASFTFGAGGAYLLMRREPDRGDTDREAGRSGARGEEDGGAGATIVIRDLAAGTDATFADVTSAVWQDGGALLAFAVRGADDVGNGLQLYDPRSGTLRSLDAAPAAYERITWRKGHADLAALRSFTDSTRAGSSHVVLVWRELDGTPRPSLLDPRRTRAIGDTTRVVSYRPLVWADDGSAIFFGVKAWAPAQPEEKEASGPGAESRADGAAPTDSAPARPEEAERARVEIWHAKDRRVIAEQKRDAERDEHRSDIAVWHLDGGEVRVLTDETLEEPEVVAHGTLITAKDTRPYARARMFGRNSADLYTVDVRTGSRRRVARDVTYANGASPEGHYLLTFEDGAYHAYDALTGEGLTLAVPSGVVWVNAEYDHPVPRKPPFGFAGWTVDDQAVLVYDRYDVWRLGLDGSAQRLTKGREKQIVYRYVDLDPEEDGIDLDGDVYFRMEAEWTLHSGYARLRGGHVARLVYRDDNVARLIRADSAAVFAYLVQDFDDSPDYYVATADFRHPRRVTATNPFQSRYAWGHSALIEYRNPTGRRLKGALLYPANYDPAERYPMIVYIYEIRSWAAKRYAVPTQRNYYDPAVWTARGYFVLEPDIVFEPRNPGVSAARTLEAAVAAVADLGVIDPARVGLVGHSWVGYETAFVATNTDIFAAAVAGAPLTDLVSMYGAMFWVAGAPETGHFEVGQERMAVPFWKDLDAYVRNSAVFNIEALETPILVEVGDADRNVNPVQGMEYYNAARRAGKPLVMLMYHNEDHGLRRKANQADYQDRILQWFGHYLKGRPGPAWITEGVPYLQQRKWKGGR